jgi:hypothetical protein
MPRPAPEVRPLASKTNPKAQAEGTHVHVHVPGEGTQSRRAESAAASSSCLCRAQVHLPATSPRAGASHLPPIRLGARVRPHVAPVRWCMFHRGTQTEHLRICPFVFANSKKKFNLQQFIIIHLSNPDLAYTRNADVCDLPPLLMRKDAPLLLAHTYTRTGVLFRTRNK